MTHYQTATALAVALAVPAYASAQDGGIPLLAEDVEAGTPIEQMIVTGTKQNRSLQDTDVSVELYDADRIDREVTFSLDDLFLRAPNVSTATGVETFDDTPFLRVNRPRIGGIALEVRF